MGLTLEKKKAIVTEVAAVAAQSSAAVAAEYIGLTVADIVELRKSARQAGVYLKVVRNTLARRALQDTPYACMTDSLVGPLLLAFSSEEISGAPRVVRDFAKSNDKLVVKLVSIDGQLLDVSQIEALADLPSLDEARAILLSVLQAPLQKFVRVLNEPGAQFVRLLAAKNDSSGE